MSLAIHAPNTPSPRDGNTLEEYCTKYSYFVCYGFVGSKLITQNKDEKPTMKKFTSRLFLAVICCLLGLLSEVLQAAADDCDPNQDIREYEFFWRGQFAGFTVNGYFSFDANKIPPSGIVREENLVKLDVSFHDPIGRLLHTYEDNHLKPLDDEGKPYLNFAFDVYAEEILQDGTWNVDDEELKYRNGFMMGEGKPSKRSDFGTQDGLAFWTRPADVNVPHLHVDDWNNQEGIGRFNFPIGFSTHEDASFMYETTAQRIATGRVGEAYYKEVNGTVVLNKLASDINAFGQSVRVRPTYRHAMKCMRTAVTSKTLASNAAARHTWVLITSSIIGLFSMFAFI